VKVNTTQSRKGLENEMVLKFNNTSEDKPKRKYKNNNGFIVGGDGKIF
jgi:hypothetical protein